MTATGMDQDSPPTLIPAASIGHRVADAFADVAAQAVREFDGRNARVRGSAVVHAVRPERWLGEIRVPAPSCRIGISGFDLGALVATDEPVTCVRCCRHLPAGTVPGQAGTEQLPLWPQGR